MPMVSRLDNSYNFRVDFKDGGSEVKLYCYIYLDYNIIVSVSPKQGEADVTEACIVTKEGLVTWSEKKRAWTPLKKEFQEALTTYVAEKHLLKD